MKTLLMAICFILSLSLGHSVDAAIIYDEAINGPLPYSLTSPPMTYAQLQSYTLSPDVGLNTIVGTSNSGETFLFQIRPDQYLKSLSVSFYTHIDGNSHVLDIGEIYPIDPQNPFVFRKRDVFYSVTPMDTIGTYNFSFAFSPQDVGTGLYQLYSGTSVQGASNENPFSLTLEVVAVPLSSSSIYFSFGAMILIFISFRNRNITCTSS